MTPARAAEVMRERAETLNLARARMAVQMRIIFHAAGEVALRNTIEAEIDSMKAANDFDRSWIG